MFDFLLLNEECANNNLLTLCYIEIEMWWSNNWKMAPNKKELEVTRDTRRHDRRIRVIGILSKVKARKQETPLKFYSKSLVFVFSFCIAFF